MKHEPNEPIPPAAEQQDEPDRQAQPADDEQSPRLSFPVVGIGASAGGLEAFTRFFKSMRADSGMAFVLIQHLPPDRESMMVDILGRATSMPVAQVDDGMEIYPNNVYIIRPGHTLTIKDGRLHLGERVDKPQHSRPVDDFFKSLAEEQQQRAICIIMSGMGSNGSAGSQAVKAVGGLVIAQEPESAEFPSMPKHLIEAGYADYILRPEDMPDTLLGYAGHPYASGELKAELAQQRDQQAYREILAIVRTRTGHDFSGYKKPTILRRILRRMGMARLTKIVDYAKALRQSSTEAGSLADDVLIHVTGFFRDPDAWEELRKNVVVPLIAGREVADSVRCWVTACSSGEEAYTLAMLLFEEAERANKHLDLKVFATDMAERTLKNARNGTYAGGIESEISPERLNRFFIKEDAIYRVRPELREMVVFAPQNLLHDPPFSRIDIVTCRNLLIYLEPDVQKRVLSLLHFGLREGGTLFLGTSETIAGVEELFVPIDKKLRIYRRIGPTRHGSVQFASHFARGAEGVRFSKEGRAMPRASVSQLTHKALLDHHTPAAVTVDRDFRIVYFHGDTSPFLDQPRGEVTRDLMVLAREHVRGAVRTALRKAVAENITVRETDGWIQTAAGDRARIVVTASPLDLKSAPDYFVVSFEERPDLVSASPQTPVDEIDATTAEMSDELQRVRAELQSTIEELQSSNEEHKASTEEVMSMNEELQSTNEELETSKEEMQSLNEELTTVNAQLQSKMDELQATTSDLSSLLTSTNLAVVFLDTQMRIRRFTPPARELIELIATDVGRPMNDLAMKFTDPDLIADSEAVLTRLVPIQREVAAGDGQWFLRRTTPYRTADNRIDGVVITFVNITGHRKMEDALRESQRRLGIELSSMADLRELTHKLLAMSDVRVALNEVLVALMALHRADMGMVQVADPTTGVLVLIAQRGFNEEYLREFECVDTNHESTEGMALRMGTRVVAKDVASDRSFERDRIAAAGYRAAQSTPLMTHAGELLGMLSTYFRGSFTLSEHDMRMTDLYASQAAQLVERMRAEEAVRRSQERFRSVVDLVPDLLWESDEHGALQWCNRRWLDYTGQTLEQLQGTGWFDVIHPEDLERSQAQIQAAIESGEPLQQEHRVRGSGGAYRWFLARAMPRHNAAGRIVQWIGAATDIQEQRAALEALAESEERFRLVLESARDFAIFMCDPQGKVTMWSVGAERMTGYTPQEALGNAVDMIFTLEDRAANAPEKEMARATVDGRAADIRWHLRKDGTQFWANGVLHAVRDAKGVVRGFVKVLRDETARKVAEDALQQAKDAAESANRVKDEFLATLSHELRTPLSAILIWTKLLQARPEDRAQLQEGLDAIRSSAEAQKQLIEDLLDTSRITAGTLRLQLRETLLTPMVLESVAAIEPTATAKGVTLEFDQCEDVGQVLADPDRLRQVVWNLLTNAVKFTPETGKVTVELRRKGQSVELKVSDTGRGISPEFLPHVFERFRQAEATTTRTTGGLGLGLTIVKQLVERHGGTIVAESEGIDQGATFIVTLPLPRVKGTVSSLSDAPKAAAMETLKPLMGVDILIVEDQPDTRGALIGLFASAGAKASTADSVEKAFKALDASRPHVLISDIGLPGEDGYSLLRKLRAREAAAGAKPLPAIALTAFARDIDQKKAIDAGFNLYLSKPVDAVRLLEAVRSIVNA